MKKRFLSIVLVLCFAFTILPLSGVSADGTVTRSAWISMLVSTFSMTVENGSTMPDNYFADISESDSFYRDILLAVEFGVIHLDAGEEFKPNDPVTREFAAQTLNACMKYQLDEGASYTFSESGTVTYPDDIQIAINRGWLSLSNGNFMPDAPITTTEAAAMLSSAKAVIDKDKISENYDSTFEFADGVVVVPDGTEVSISEDYTVTITDNTAEISEGTVFVVYTSGIPVALKALSVSTEDNLTIISATPDGAEGAIVSADSEGVCDIDLENFKAEEVETFSVTDMSETNPQPELMEVSLQSISYDKKTKKLTAKKDIKVSEHAAGSITVELSNIKLTHKIDAPGGFYEAYLTADTSVTKTINFDFGDYVGIPNSITIGYVPIEGIGNITLEIEISIKGGMTETETGTIMAGFSYQRGSEFRLFNGYKKKTYSFTAEAEVSVAIVLSANIELIFVEAGVWAKVGVRGYYKMKDYTYVDGERPLKCETIGAYLFANIGARASINYIIDKKSWNKTIDLFTEENSPVRVYYHYEDGQLVDKCARGKDGNDTHVKYTTSIKSAYFNPSPSYGRGSYTNSSTGETVTLWTYTLDSSNNATVTGYKGSASALVLPSKIDGYTVTAIANSAFKNNTKITSFIMPDTVKTVGSSAFYGCTNLRYVDLSNGIIEIANSTFCGCTSLSSMEIPDSVITIGNSAFNGCTNLSNVQLSKNLETLSYGAFQGCKSLTSIHIPKSLKDTESYANPTSVFYNSGLKNVTFEEGITYIPAHLFAYCY
ncbi:MAG: leucine-rich repeat protein, partial [Clostridia bacterium]|nr:leucine-rich repeat protein [Clostridia bacterium]